VPASVTANETLFWPLTGVNRSSFKVPNSF